MEASSVNVFNEAMGPRIDCGLCLASLVNDAESNTNSQTRNDRRTPEQVLKTRNKIKHGKETKFLENLWKEVVIFCFFLL